MLHQSHLTPASVTPHSQNVTPMPSCAARRLCAVHPRQPKGLDQSHATRNTRRAQCDVRLDPNLGAGRVMARLLFIPRLLLRTIPGLQKKCGEPR